MDFSRNGRRRIRIRAARATTGLGTLALGGFLATWYLEWTGVESEQISALHDGLWIAWLGLFMLSALLRPDDARPAGCQPSAVVSGVGVVLVTGIAAAGYLLRGGMTGGAVVAMVLTVAIAGLVYRFATANADKIGEARFDTSAR